jgi:hypothetical protein
MKDVICGVEKNIVFCYNRYIMRIVWDATGDVGDLCETIARQVPNIYRIGTYWKFDDNDIYLQAEFKFEDIPNILVLRTHGPPEVFADQQEIVKFLTKTSLTLKQEFITNN